jgi:hypothetical protein
MFPEKRIKPSTVLEEMLCILLASVAYQATCAIIHDPPCSPENVFCFS